MRKAKCSKRTLLMSAISLMLCVAMFIGTTFAWFTDSAVSTNNRIIGGSLQIDLELLETDGSWTSVKESGKAIFDYKNYEPGYTDVKILRITNDGTLALEWVAKIISENEMSMLADVIDVYVKHGVVSYPSNRSDLDDWDKMGTLAEFTNSISATANGNLEAGACAYFGIALKMRESAGNEFTGVNLGTFDIQILATQYTYEKDSFDQYYDENAKTYITEPVYFRSLSNAITAISTDTISNGESECKEYEASACVKWENGGYVVTVLRAITENTPIEVAKDMTLVLNGYEVTFEDTETGFWIPDGNNVVFRVNGQAPGSMVTIYGADRSTAIRANSGTCIISGGAYVAKAENAGTEDDQNPCIEINGDADLRISDATVYASDTDAGTPCGIYIAENAKMSATKCDILAKAPRGLGVHGVHNLGNVVVSGSSIKGYANYTGNSAGTAYASHSRGVYSSGKMTVVDCYVIGTHSGIASVGTLYVDGGVYESYGHGGIYFAGSNTTSYIKDATVQYSEMPSGYYADNIAGTNLAGMYVGGGKTKSNIVVYADNCQFAAPVQAIVIRGTSGEKDNIVHVSNSTISDSTKIRVDDNNQLSIGIGNNFTEIHTSTKTSKKGRIEITNENYRSVIDAVFQQTQNATVIN